MGKGGGGGSSSVLSAEQNTLLNSLTEVLNQQVGQGVDFPLEDPFVAGPSPLQTTAFSGAQDLGNEFDPFFQQSLPDIAAGNAPLSIDQTVEKYLSGFKENVEDPSLQFFGKTIEQLAQRYGEFGSGGGLYRASSEAGADLSANLALQRGGLLTEGLRTGIGLEESSRDRALQAFAAIGEGERRDVETQLQAGGEQRGIQSQVLGEDLARSFFEAPYSNPWLTQFLGPVLSTQPRAVTGGGGGGGAAIGSAISSIGSIIGIIAALCYCAEVYFGFDTPKWHTARWWITHDWPKRSVVGRAFKWMYERYGLKASRVLRRSRMLRELMRPFFEWCAYRGLHG